MENYSVEDVGPSLWHLTQLQLQVRLTFFGCYFSLNSCLYVDITCIYMFISGSCAGACRSREHVHAPPIVHHLPYCLASSAQLARSGVVCMCMWVCLLPPPIVSGAINLVPDVLHSSTLPPHVLSLSPSPLSLPLLELIHSGGEAGTEVSVKQALISHPLPCMGSLLIYTTV